jgi:hypothetical protein
MTDLRIMAAGAAGTSGLRQQRRKGFALFAPDLLAELRRKWPIAALLCAAPATTFLAPTTTLTAQELADRDQINVGIAETASPQLRMSAQAEKELKVEPSGKFEFADHVANGIAMRNRTAGTIHLRGAPVPSKVLAALLYFNFSDEAREGRRTVPVLFDGNLVVAGKTGDHDDPCWGMAGNHSYVADVRALLPTRGHLNQDYQVVIQFDEHAAHAG